MDPANRPALENAYFETRFWHSLFCHSKVNGKKVIVKYHTGFWKYGCLNSGIFKYGHLKDKIMSLFS